MATEASGQESRAFREAVRVVAGVTARAERRALAWLVTRVPAAVTSDQLTLLGLVATAVAGALYAASSLNRWLLLGVNVALALNWLGDSLDGSLARHRRSERPRFGFYVDHLTDAFGALFLLAGLGSSGLMSPLVAAALLASYLLLAVETYLATYTLGSFRVSWGPVGGTELRLILMGLNLAALVSPGVGIAGARWRLFDLAGSLAAGTLVILAAGAGLRATLALARLEGWARAGSTTPVYSPTASGSRPAPAPPPPTSAAPEAPRARA